MSEAVVSLFRSAAGGELEKSTWSPKGVPRAVVQLVHGMAEHIDRYDAVAKRLN